MKYRKIYDLSYANKIKEYSIKNNRTFTYYIETMGCALNENDSMKYMGILEQAGMTRTSIIDNANVIVFNTCAVRENAEDKLFGRIGMLKKQKKTSKECIICVVGCMSEQNHVIDKIKKSYPFIDIALGTKAMDIFTEKLYKCITDRVKTRDNTIGEGLLLEEVPIVYQDKYRASVSIIYGCNNFCSYCIVPYVRGRERSRMPEDIIKDIEKLAKDGYKEITLLGQNVNSYGNDFSDEYLNYNFVSLLKDISKIDGIDIIKFVSPHPKDFSDELIEHIAENNKISRLIHLPLQSGSTKILSAMNRKYTKEQYLALAIKMKEKIKDIAFSTDIIVGFPGESEKDFEDTLDVVRTIGFDMIYMFCYSIRRGTRAEKMPNQIEESIKVNRLETLKKVYEEILNSKNDEKIGTVENILVEGKSKNNDLKYTGRTKDNKVVIFDAFKEDVGKILKIKIVENNKWYLTGEIQR